MKIRYFLNAVTIVIGILSWVCGYTSTESGQSECIDEIRFDPPIPKPGDSLKISITLFPNEKSQRKISIELRTWADANTDCIYQTNEETQHRRIQVKDNEDGKDEEKFEDELLVQIYNVPQQHFPEKYTVIVACGDDVKSESINIPSPIISSCNSSNSSIPIWQKIYNKFNTLPNIFRKFEILHTTDGKKYTGASSLYTYSLQDKQLKPITQNEKILFLSPTWSLDGKKIACVINQNKEKQIAWTNVTGETVGLITKGPIGINPFWLSDNTHIIFLQNNRLRITNTDDHSIRIIAEELPVKEIIAVKNGENGNTQIIYKALKRVAYDNTLLSTVKALYLLELDHQLKPMLNNINELVNRPYWFFTTNISPSGEQIVYNEEVASVTTIFIETADNKRIRLFKDEYNYYEPEWSPDGNTIVFVSDHP